MCMWLGWCAVASGMADLVPRPSGDRECDGSRAAPLHSLTNLAAPHASIESAPVDESHTSERDGNLLSSKHLIFLSHSGAQKSFVEQLCLDVERHDISPFFDKRHDSLPIGEHFPKRIFEAINQCQVGVVVLSEEFFTRTKWPMLEFVAFVARRAWDETFTIIPVFLGLTHGQCRDKANHEKWLRIWQGWARQDGRIKVKEWQNALRVFGNTNGISLNDKLDEMKCRQEIVEAICRRVGPNMRRDDSHVHGRSGLSSQHAPWTIEPMHGAYSWTNSWTLPTAGEGIVWFTAKGTNDIHVAISPSSGTRIPMYEIVIGGWGNGKSVVRRRAQGSILTFVEKVGVINSWSPNRLWVSIDKRTRFIQIGCGQDILMQYMDPCFIAEARLISFTTWDVPITYSNVVMRKLEQKPGTSHYDVEDHFIQLDQVMDAKWSILPSYGKYTWDHHWKLPRMGQGLLAFEAEGNSDIHIAISARPQTMKPMYEIVIGGWSNTQSAIRRESGGQTLCVVETGITSDTQCFWVSMDDQAKLIRLGRGMPCQNTFCEWTDPAFLSDSLYFSFTTFSTSITYSSVQIGTLPKGRRSTIC